MTDMREVEAKFIADDATIDQLLAARSAGAFSLLRAGTKVQDDLYFDTAEGHLKLHGSSLRIRRKQDQLEMTFKGERAAADERGHTVSRLEDEVTLPAGEVADLEQLAPLVMEIEPSPLRRAREMTGTHALLPTARLVTSRSIVNATSNTGAAIELSVDRCRAERLADGRQVSFVEVEAELKTGSIDDLGRLIDDLRRAFHGLTPSTQTKLERALD